MNITKMNQLEYLIAFVSHRTALSDRYAMQAEKTGAILGARMDGNYAGFACVSDDIDCIRITYGLTVPEFRNQGIFSALVRCVLENSRKPVRLSISTTHPFYEAVSHTCRKLGFVITEKSTVFSCSSRDRDLWFDFMERKGKRLCATLERQGYTPVSFDALDEELLNQLRCSDRSEYANMFHPTLFLDDPAKKLSPDLSFAAVKDGRLVSYCLVSMADRRTAVFEQISVSAREQGQGIILLPYICSMNQFFEKELSAAFYAMYGSNRHANAFRNKVLMLFPTSQSTMENYCYNEMISLNGCSAEPAEPQRLDKEDGNDAE